VSFAFILVPLFYNLCLSLLLIWAVVNNNLREVGEKKASCTARPSGIYHLAAETDYLASSACRERVSSIIF